MMLSKNEWRRRALKKFGTTALLLIAGAAAATGIALCLGRLAT